MLELGKNLMTYIKIYQKLLTILILIKYLLKAKTLTTYKNINIKKRGNIFQQEEDIDLTFNDIISNNDYLMIKGQMQPG